MKRVACPRQARPQRCPVVAGCLARRHCGARLRDMLHTVPRVPIDRAAAIG
jgi:hypothetical protein